MSTTTNPALDQLLQERCGSRVLRVFGEHVRTQKNFHCQLQDIDHRSKEVVIDGRRLLNFNAIDYLGLDFHPEMIRAAREALDRWGTQIGQSRAASELTIYEDLEQRIGRFLGVDNVIVYTNVTLANHGVVPLLAKKGTLILMDWEAHSSVQRAATEAKGAGAALVTFNHDDFDQLDALLTANRAKYRHVMIALDGVYSMLGTYLDLPRYQEVAAKHNAMLFVDDAHGFGVVGPGGRGIVSYYGADYGNIIYVGSLEKAVGTLGGFVVLPRQARDLIRYTSYTYVFCGQMPPANLASAVAAMDIIEREGQQRIDRLNEMTFRIKAAMAEMGYEVIGEDRPFPLILVKVGDVYAAPKVSQFFYDEGIHILTTGFPIVPLSRGAMVRISLSATHTDAHIDRLIDVFRKLRNTLDIKS
jgi:7-keto-8-aminopelargonate synthetase-like enzyme